MLVDNVVTCQCAGLDTTLSLMCGRLFLTLVLALTCLMIAIAPIATMALDDHVACQQQSAPVELHGTHGHDGHHLLPANPASDEDDGVAFIPCCSQGCIFDVPLFVDSGPSEASFAGISAEWTATGLTDLTGRNGLRRPPRA
ncbi:MULTISPECIES: hypothetical protein [Mameliella]|nr:MULTISPECIES: hypothetical protein [Mameliella]MDD9730056.1 hypothetical protein [Mameliella sp. AT18]ODM46069.1 hypothetical protein A9320_08670 [Ruegeria sp. PBVC088]